MRKSAVRGKTKRCKTCGKHNGCLLWNVNLDILPCSYWMPRGVVFTHEEIRVPEGSW